MAIDIEKATVAFTRIRAKLESLKAIQADVARGNFTNVGDISVQIGNTADEIGQEIDKAEEAEPVE